VIASGLLLCDGFVVCFVVIDVLGDAEPRVLIEVLGDALSLVLNEVLGDTLWLLLNEVLGDTLRLVLGDALLLVLIEVLGLGLSLSPGPHTMMWLIALSPFLPPGSKTPLPLVSAQTVSPDEALANKVLVYGSTFLDADFTTTRS
jgi:hypothetical protein